ncbi:MAG: hypothetical protein KAW12_15230 [Candidatus Aminicenantes bacterium]|nr:hypothetical protein [Candidatus Aminicenantes bacterium]
MKRYYFVIILFIAVGFLAVGSIFSDQNSFVFDSAGKAGLQNKEATWTIMVYLDGDNEHERAAIADFLEMAAVGSTKAVNIAVQFDRIAGHDSAYGDWTGTKRFLVTKGLKPSAASAAMDAGEVNMGDPEALLDFIYWSKTNYPAANYALILWHHGSKQQQSKEELQRVMEQKKKESIDAKLLGLDMTAGGDGLFLPEVKRALRSSGGVQLIGFDGCLLGMVEAAYELKDYGQVLVGSDESDPRGGWPYDAILNDLTAHPTWTPLQFGAAVVDRYDKSYGPDAACAALDLTKMTAITESIAAFSRDITNYWESDPAAVRKAALTMKEEIATVVIHKTHGLPIYFPGAEASFDSAYNDSTFDFPRHSRWGEFLQGYFDAMKGSWIADKRMVSREFTNTGHVDLYHFCEQLDRPLSTYYTETRTGSEFFGEGTAQNFQEDDDYITYALPFDFPFYGQIIEADSTIYISSNGYIDFDSNSDHADYSNTGTELSANKRIAPCWADLKTSGQAQQNEDVYIIGNEGFFAIRWAAETYGDAEPVNVEVICFRDGHIQFNYGGANEDITPNDTTPTIGISKGDSTNYDFSVYNGEDWLKNVDSDLFSPTPSITVTSPNGSESWTVNTPRVITWTSIGKIGDVKIQYSTNEGESWETITASHANCGEYRWIVPDDASIYCLVKISESVDGETPSDQGDNLFSIVSAVNPIITINSPNGFENLPVGSSHAITWVNSGRVGNVDIDYSTTGGETWNSIVQNYDNTGSYNWTVPNNTSESCRVRVEETDGSPSDVSDDLFAIVTADSVTVTLPNGSESWDVGSEHNITWNSAGPVGDVRIEYSTSGGEAWTTIVTSTDNDGTYRWTVPVTPSEDCLVRVGKSDSEAGPSDVSDQEFTINSATALIVTYPNGGESLVENYSYAITWASSGQVGNVKLDYSTSGGESWTNIVSSIDNNGRYAWTVPQSNSTNCKIRISDVSTGEIVDMSDAVFKIVSLPSITVTSPNGSENWAAGTFHNITWTSTGTIGCITIEYSTTGGETWTTVVTSTPNNGSYTWIVPDTPSQSCKVRVKSCDADGVATDTGDYTFTITGS